MFLLWLTLTVTSAVVLATGFVWIMISSGETRVRNGEQVGAETMASGVDEDDEGLTLREASTFKGEAIGLQREASFSFGEIKALLRARRWRQALPLLLTMGGLAGLLLFGALALMAGLEDRLVGGLALLLVLYTLVRAGIDFVRA